MLSVISGFALELRMVVAGYRPMMAAHRRIPLSAYRPHPVVYAALFSACVWGLLIAGVGSILG